MRQLLLSLLFVGIATASWANEVFILSSATEGGNHTVINGPAVIVGINARGGGGSGSFILKDGGNNAVKQLTFYTPTNGSVDFNIGEPGLHFITDVTIQLNGVSGITVQVR